MGWTYAQKTIKVIDLATYKPVANVMVSKADKSDVYGKTNEKGEIQLNFKELNFLFSHPDYLSIVYSVQEIESSKYKVFINQNVNSFEEVVVSASKFEEKKNDVSQKIQVLRASEIASQNQSSMADVLANTGNVMVQKSQLGGGSPIIRGFETNKVLMVVDGIRMNNAIYRGGHLQNIVTLDNSIMDRVEVVFGAGSVVYGSDALGGVMNFTTKSPTLSCSNDLLLVKASAFTRYFSAANGYSGHADVSVGTKRFGSLTSFTYSKYGDLRQGANRNPYVGNFGSRPWYAATINGVDSMIMNADTNVQVGSAYTQYDILQKFTFKQNDAMTHKLNFQLSNSGDVPRYDRLTQMSGSNPKYATWNYGPQKRLMAAYTLEFTKKNKFFDQGRVILAYQSIEESRITRKFNNVWENHNIENLDIFTLNADFAKKMNKHEFRYGAEAYLNKVNSTAFAKNVAVDTSTAISTRYPDGGSSMKSAAVYATHTWEVCDKFIINDGLRFSYVGLNANFTDKTYFPFPFNSINQNNSAFNGNLGFVYLPAKTWRITGNFSTGFRAPNVDDLSKVFESVPGSVIVPNPDLKVEYTMNGELGVSKEILPGLRANVNVYYTKLTNALITQNSQFQGADSIMYDGQLSQVMSTVNAGKAYIYGIEGALAGQVNKYISVLGTVNYTKGRVVTDTVPYPLDHIPPVFGKFSVISSINRLRTEFFVNYSGWKRIKDYNMIGEDNFSYATAQGMPSWFTLNARVSYAITKDISLQVACENILDQNYRQFASNI
ncbi:MAG: TonB-dependent receptor, partial [Flavobacteriales bacterium]|nr:TonB-dependent receptor [Flavobacteriales bacterium]